MFARSAVAAFVAVPLLASTVFATTCTRTYTVQEGDWCDTISAAHNVSTYQLAAVNPGIDNICDNLEPNDVICLGTDGEDCTTTHVVVTGDTCDSITSTYNINATMLYTNNPNIDSACDNIYTGEVLCVANQVLSPVASSLTVSATSATPTSTTATPTSTSSAATPTETEAESDVDSDDEDLPWCDEL